MRTGRIATGVLLAAVIGAGGAGTAQAAMRISDPTITWDATSTTAEYGEYWTLSAVVTDAAVADGAWTASGTLSGVPSGYATSFSAFPSDATTVLAYVAPAADARPLPAGSYTANLTMTSYDGTGPAFNAPSAATLTITPAALGMTLSVTPDPSNPTNAIISTALTGPFRNNFFTITDPQGPLPPVGSWRIVVTDEGGQTVYDDEIERTDTQDVMGASSYWSDVSPGTYTVKASFTATGGAASNFAITAPAPVTYTAAPAPGSTSTATPAPPAPPPAADDAGMTLPAWIPLVAGVVTAGLIALLIVQIVRLRRAGVPAMGEQA
jgi:hypothetical protein